MIHDRPTMTKQQNIFNDTTMDGSTTNWLNNKMPRQHSHQPTKLQRKQPETDQTVRLANQIIISSALRTICVLIVAF